MRGFSLLVAILFTFVVTSSAFPDLGVILGARQDRKNGTSMGNGNKNSTNKACKKMEKLTKLTNLANNQTKIDMLVSKGKLNQTQVDILKSKAANITQELKVMSSNMTLVQECAVLSANKKLKKSCRKMKKLQILDKFANNKTAMDAFVAKKKFNETQMAKLQEAIGNATTKLKAMQANQTLVDGCAELQKESQKGT
jgi:hypothetical protein